MTTRIPLVVLTGFLGSGKTTLLRAALADPAMAGALVVINELGEIGLDHHLVEHVTADAVLLKSGCLCCELRDDVAETLRSLLAKRARGEMRPFDRIIVETTGLAEPEPLMQTVLAAPGVAGRVELTAVVVTVDALLGCETLERHLEAAKQVAAADRVVITKTDLAPQAGIDRVAEVLTSLNPTAEALRSRPDAPMSPQVLFGPRGREARKCQSASRPLSSLSHTHQIVTASAAFATPLPADGIDRWVVDLLAAHGPSLLRLKGIFALREDPRPLVLHAVQHVIHRPELLPSWPSDDRRTRVVVIAHGLDRAVLDDRLNILSRSV